jgi:hypothetical protein
MYESATRCTSALAALVSASAMTHPYPGGIGSQLKAWQPRVVELGHSPSRVRYWLPR